MRVMPNLYLQDVEDTTHLDSRAIASAIPSLLQHGVGHIASEIVELMPEPQNFGQARSNRRNMRFDCKAACRTDAATFAPTIRRSR